jgi:hypothetical protein
MSSLLTRARACAVVSTLDRFGFDAMKDEFIGIPAPFASSAKETLSIPIP